MGTDRHRRPRHEGVREIDGQRSVSQAPRGIECRLSQSERRLFRILQQGNRLTRSHALRGNEFHRQVPPWGKSRPPDFLA